MAKKLYEENNIKDIAAAIREKTGETRQEDVLADHYTLKTSNMTGHDSKVVNSIGEKLDTTFKIEGAVSIKIEYSSKYIWGNTIVPTLQINGTSYSSKQYTSTDSSGGNAPVVVEVAGNSVTIFYQPVGSDSLVGFYSEIRGYDAEGNIINVQVGKEEVPNTFKVSEMANAVRSIGGLPEEAFKISGNCSYKFAYGGWNWYIDTFKDKIITENITALNYMFYYNSELAKVPFQINITNAASFEYAFSYMHKLSTAPEIRGTLSWSTSTSFSNIFASCDSIRNLDGVFVPEMMEGFSDLKITSQYSCPKTNNMFSYNYSLRKVPDWFYSFKLNETSTAFPSYSSGLYYYTFNYCAVLENILNLPAWRCAGAQTSNMFNYTCNGCSRLTNFTFETQADGTPYEVKWKSQTIDLSQNIGYAASDTYILSYNSGITKDKEVWNDATYQTNKNDPDWYGRSVEYSRYNLESAIATINSLPDTSAYLASAGGTNTIKFKKNSGLNTDGGGITADAMAEASAIAASKGWTVSIA